jgi:pimeloyl-ACP methyl ester carboxylesterase
MMKKIITTLFCILIFNYGRSQIIDTLVDVGGYKIHFNILKGKGIPILFESGNGDDGTVWKDILSPLHDATGATLITYDRAGLGKSEIDTTSISFENEIKGLETGLKKLGYFQEVFIVSHSFGSFYSSLIAYRTKSKVKGAVFIDVATPCFFTSEWTTGFVDSISSRDWEMIKQYKPGLYYVLSNLQEISIFMRDKFLHYKTPVTLIRAENILSMVKDNEREKWIECLASYGTMENHTYVVAKNSEHKVWEKNPQIVIEETIKLYKQISGKMD